MNTHMFIRSVIFLIAGLITFFFSKKLNDFKNDLLKKFGFKNKIKDRIVFYCHFNHFISYFNRKLTLCLWFSSYLKIN